MSQHPHYRYAVATREGSAAWVDTSVESSIDEILALVECALLCGQSIMIEPINDYGTPERSGADVSCQPAQEPQQYRVARAATGDEPGHAA